MYTFGGQKSKHSISPGEVHLVCEGTVFVKRGNETTYRKSERGLRIRVCLDLTNEASLASQHAPDTLLALPSQQWG